jgi:chloride channel protein, CIC family
MGEGDTSQLSNERHEDRPRRQVHIGKQTAGMYARWIGDRESLRMVTLALIVGGMAGLAGVALRTSVFALQGIFVFEEAPVRALVGPYLSVFLPAVGGLIVGLLVVGLAQEIKGAGVADVVRAVRFQGSRMRAWVAAVKVVATSIAIGSGGSAGIEGPIIQIGSAIGSGVGQRLRLSEDELRITLAAGAAAGIASTFNTPLAGVFFALEVILVDFSSRSFGLVVLASVVANVVSRAFLGGEPIFPVPAHPLVSPAELLLYLVLGVAAALVGLAFILVLDQVEAAFSRWQVPAFAKPAIGGLAVGILGLAFPQVLGLGYRSIGEALSGGLPVAVMAALIGVKLVAVALTVGSGSSGGVIGPSLYLGAMLGGTAGSLFHGLLPQATAGSGAYALVGMAAVFAATAQAPITAVFTLFEMTNDYYQILPLLVACSASAYLAHRASPHTIYSRGLTRQGVDLQTGRVSLPPLHGTMYLHLVVGGGFGAAGKRVQELDLPSECILISIRRRDGVVIPRGNTALRDGDRIIAAATPETAAIVRQRIEGEA